MQWESKRKALEITECLSLAWEPLLIPNFVFVKPMLNGYRIDKTSDLGHVYLTADITQSAGNSRVQLWITRYVWGDSNKSKAKSAVTSCL